MQGVFYQEIIIELFKFKAVMLAAFFIHNDCFEGMDVLNHKRIIVCSIFMKQFKNFIILFITCISQICNRLIMR